MNYFTQSIGEKAKVSYYLHEPSSEINPDKKYPVMIIVPGGGYIWTSDREAEPIASQFYAQDYHAVVVRYSTEGRAAYENGNFPDNPSSNYPQPLIELAKVIVNLKEHEEEWAVDVSNINLLGFSAGGNLVGQLAVYWNEKWLENLVGASSHLIKPKNIAAAYPVLDFTISERGMSEQVNYATLGTKYPKNEDLMKVSPVYHVNGDTIPMFLWHTTEDPLVPSANSLKMAIELDRVGVPYELHIYQRGIHGIALGDERTSRKENQSNEHAKSWLPILFSWLESSDN